MVKHRGQYGRPLNWGVYKGRVLDIFTSGSRTYAVMAWFRDATLVLPRTYPIDDLEVVR